MKMKTLLVLFAAATLGFQVPSASGQYTPRPGSSGTQVFSGQVGDDNPYGLGLAFVTHLNGEPLYRSAEDEEWGALSPNLSLRIGDRIWAQDDSKIEVRFPLGATAWVNYESELDIARMERGSRADTIQLALVSGEASFDVKGFARTGSVFQVDLPGASIRTFRGARFRVNTLPDGTAQVGVISGSIVLETPDGFADVSGGRMAEIEPDGRVLLDFLPDVDEWDGWVQSRAALYARTPSSLRYLPADLSPYAHEFDTSGRWENDRRYGSIWVPAVEQGWSPYSNGRWVWQGNDYVWLGFDPWYAPFHFGRWSWSVTIGWFWIVPRGRASWSPGYVGWSVVGDEVSWVPLGHDEVYYGYGNYGPGSVNITRTTNITITNIYVNSRVNNGVVAVRKDDFLRGRIRHQRVAPSRNPFERGGAGGLKILGRAPVQEIKPIRETRVPRPDAEVRRTSLPPARLERQSQAIRQRIAAPTKEKSAFKPDRKPAPLKNVRKEQQLEQWQPEKAPAAVKKPKRDEAAGQPAPPAGKRRFKRVREPGDGDAGQGRGNDEDRGGKPPGKGSR